MTDYEDILKVIETCKNVNDVLRRHIEGTRQLPLVALRQICTDLSDAVIDINTRVFGIGSIIYPDPGQLLTGSGVTDNIGEVTAVMSEWIAKVSSIIEFRNGLPADMDEDFYRRLDYLTYGEYKNVRDEIIDSIERQSAEVKKRLSLYYQTYSYFWGSLNTETGDYEVVDNRLSEIRNHRDEFIQLYEALVDYRSKYVLISFLDYWATYDPYGTLTNMRETVFKDYYDLDIVKPSGEGVMVDLGAFTGDSAYDYIKTYRDYKAIYCFEISEDNVRAIRDNLSEFHDINIIQKAAGDKKGTMKIKVHSGIDSGNSVYDKITDTDYKEIPVTTVDDEVVEKVTLIKMDIEGAEYEALLGCENHIRNDHPKLLISVYHNNRDIWRLFRLIREMSPDYRFYLRSNGRQWGPAEIVLYAI